MIQAIFKIIRGAVFLVFAGLCAVAVVAPYKGDVARALGTIVMMAFFWAIADALVKWLHSKATSR